MKMFFLIYWCFSICMAFLKLQHVELSQPRKLEVNYTELEVKGGENHVLKHLCETKPGKKKNLVRKSRDS